jgi:hypothetical protein
MARPKVILFDVNETLLDLQPVKEGIGKLLGGGPEAARRWTTSGTASCGTFRPPKPSSASSAG